MFIDLTIPEPKQFQNIFENPKKQFVEKIQTSDLYPHKDFSINLVVLTASRKHNIVYNSQNPLPERPQRVKLILAQVSSEMAQYTVLWLIEKMENIE